MLDHRLNALFLFLYPQLRAATYKSQAVEGRAEAQAQYRIEVDQLRNTAFFIKESDLFKATLSEFNLNNEVPS